jgi:predicted alpha/beta-fold hydrolase
MKQNRIAQFFSMSSAILPKTSARLALSLFSQPRRLPRPPEESEFWKTGTPLELTSRHSARIWGKHGPRVILVHGWEGRGSQWHKWVPELVHHGFQAICWEGPAHGESEGSRTNLFYFARAMAKDLTELRDVHACIGHSFGGLALTQLPRLGVPMSHTVTVSSPTEIQNIFARYGELIQLRPRSRDYLIPILETKLEISIEELEPRAILPQYRGQFLCVHDELDKEIPFSEFTSLRQKFPGYGYLSTHGLGHRRILRDPAVIKSIIEFLKK